MFWLYRDPKKFSSFYWQKNINKALMNVEHPPARHMLLGISVIESLIQILYLSRPRFRALRAGRTSNHAIAMAMA